jgi:hypothetical protein
MDPIVNTYSPNQQVQGSPELLRQYIFQSYF